MCCQRCIEAVESTLNTLSSEVKEVQLGRAVYVPLANVTDESVRIALKKRGFEIIISAEERTTEQIKIWVIERIHHSFEHEIDSEAIHAYLERKSSKPFRLLNSIFREITGQSILNYIVLQRIERVKTLIGEGHNNFSEIAIITGYKTLQHLSTQFKKVTGISMLEYRKTEFKEKLHIDKI
jgi:AraC family transcriptional regulator